MRLIVTLLLLALTVGCTDDYLVSIGVNDDGTSFYYDPNSIEKSGKFRRVWEIQSLEKRGTDSIRSRRILYEYDCKEERYRTLYLSAHFGPVASGKTLYSGEKKGEWKDIDSETVAKLQKIVCAK